MAILKPSKLDIYEGNRDALAVNASIYQVDIYLNLLALRNPKTELNRRNESSVCFHPAEKEYSKLVLYENTVRWYTSYFKAFKIEGKAEFVTQDSVRKQRDKLNRLLQRTIVALYLKYIRYIVISISNISEAKQLHKFLNGLKPMIRLEMLKFGCGHMSDTSPIAWNTESSPGVIKNYLILKYSILFLEIKIFIPKLYTNIFRAVQEITNLFWWQALGINFFRSRRKEKKILYSCHAK